MWSYDDDDDDDDMNGAQIAAAATDVVIIELEGRSGRRRLIARVYRYQCSVMVYGARTCTLVDGRVDDRAETDTL